MDNTNLIFLFLAIGVIAFLYSSVGHAGASGYIAVMTLLGLSTATIRPTALVLNILVALIASFQFWRAGHFSKKLFWPFALLSVPGCLPRRLSPVTSSNFENHYRIGAQQATAGLRPEGSAPLSCCARVGIWGAQAACL